MRKPRIVLNVCVLLTLAVSAVLTGGCTTEEQMKQYAQNAGYMETWSEEDGQYIPNLVYDKEKNLQYDMYLPKDLKKDAPVRLLLFIHGGAWKEGTRYDVAYACKYYAKHNCVTATLEYSLLSKEHPEVKIPTMLDEITECIGAIKEKLTADGYQTSKIALAGVSAGGHLALLYSYSRAEESPIPIAFVFEKVGPCDFTEKTLGAKDCASLLAFLTGKRVRPSDLSKPKAIQFTESLSPVCFVTKKSVPTIYAYGWMDFLVKINQRDALTEALEKNGVPHICVDFPHSHHAMWSDPDKTEEFRKAVLSYCDTYMP